MPYEVIGREVVRGCITRDRWRATVTIMCSDRIPEGAPSPFLLDIKWRQKRDASGPPGQPDDARPIVLTFRKRTAAASGEIRFDSADGPATRGFSSDTQELLSIFGRSGSAGAETDVVLEVSIEGEVRSTIPMSVGAVGTSVEIRDDNGVDPAPASLVVADGVNLKAVVTPAAAGSYRWASASGDGLVINGSSENETVEVEARGFSGVPRTLGVLFTPDAGGPAVMGVQTFAVQARYQGRLEDRSVAPHYAESATGHSFLPAGVPLEVVNQLGNVVFNGVTQADGRFSIILDLGQQYEMRVTNFQGLGP